MEPALFKSTTKIMQFGLGWAFLVLFFFFRTEYYPPNEDGTNSVELSMAKMRMLTAKINYQPTTNY